MATDTEASKQSRKDPMKPSCQTHRVIIEDFRLFVECDLARSAAR